MDKSKRDFLKLMSAYSSMGIGASTFNTVIDLLLSDSIRRAFAQGTTSTNSRLLVLQAYGAPERWHFDNFLDPYNSGVLSNIKTAAGQDNVNQQIVNNYAKVGERYMEACYKFANVKGIKAPFLWSQNTGSASGGERPIADLLDHMLTIRGIDNGNSVHPISSRMQFQPAVGGPTMTGILADYSPLPVSHISVNPRESIFQSTSGKTALSFGTKADGGTDLISQLLAPFKKPESFSSSEEHEKSLLEKMEKFNSLISQEVAKSKDIDSHTKSNLAGAKTLMFDKIESLSGNYESLKTKYQLILSSSMKIEMPGINDLAVGDSNVSARDNKYRFAGNIVTNEDLRHIMPYDLPGAAPGGTLDQMADVFAFAEFSLVNNFSNSIHLNLVPWRNLNPRNKDGGLITSGDSTFDAHSFGAMIQVLLMNTFYQALSGCMLELIDRLKEAGSFNDTLIQFFGEFERSPKFDGTGSDHAGYASISSLWTGKQEGPAVIGDVVATTSDKYKGSYGKGAADSSGHVNNLGNVASTIANILEVPTSSPNNSSLVSLKDGKIHIPDSKKAKNLESA